MASRTVFLVEHYLPGQRAEHLGALAEQVRSTVTRRRATGALRLLHAAIVPDDESLLCLIEAPSEQLVRNAYARAGVGFDRISRALEVETHDPVPHRQRAGSKPSRKGGADVR